MGAKESKPSCINYEDAIKRVTDSEFRRIKEAFKKSAGPGSAFLSQNAFQQDVLCEGIPQNVAELLYVACGGTQKGISFKDVFCGLVLLTRGTEEDKIRFLWNLYCNDSGTYILKAEYGKSINFHGNEALTLFAKSDRVNFDQFREWILSHRNTTVLSKWLLSDTCINLTSELETPTFYQSLAGVTHLEEKDIGDLEKEFWRLKSTSLTGQLDLQLLGPLISPPIPKTALAGLFSAFDENRDGHIDFKELCCGVSAACRGPNVERCKFCFKIFDIDRDGILNYEETIQMIDILIFVAKENHNATTYKTINRKDVISDLLTFARKNVAHVPPKETLDVTSLDSDQSVVQKSISLTQEDFMMWTVESSLNLVQPFLDLTFEVCHIVFGLSPQCKHMEYDIVKGWLTREEKRGYSVGQFWYLISKEWWVSWTHYTQNFSATPCYYCKKSITNCANQRQALNGVDEAMVCDESFNSHSSESVGDTIAAGDSSSLGSRSSGISDGRHSSLKPGPIDNTNLITVNPYKSVRTLTGEGGHLKRDTPLVQNHDFELVPKSLWKALTRWYGEILPLPRQVIQSPNSPEVELELYPLNLRILMHQQMPLNSPTVSNWGAVSGGYGVVASGGGYAALSATPSVLQPPKKYLAYTAAFSRLATIRQIGEFLCEHLRWKAEDIRLWHISGTSGTDSNPILLEEENMTLKELLIRDNDQILLEVRNKDLTWPEELGSLSMSGQGGSQQDRRLTRASIYSVHAPGATGLHNLGNTCFMNAALQVLFNTQPLTQYFKRNMHLFEMNILNKLGTKGQLATRYGELLKEIWTATTRSVAPLKLRFCVTKHAPQFAGGGQHDSQELLEWMLDALHEDLNRVTEKPYSELKDSDGRPDKVVAFEAWSQHHSRNQSIVIDLFYGQLKSKVSCLCCGRESVRFDPFSLLSLPLPVENYLYFEILVIPLDGAIPMKYGLRLNPDSKYIDLKKKLSTLCHLSPYFMLVCELSNSQIRQILYDEQKIKSSSATELYVYQLPEDCNETRSRTSSTLGVNIEKGLKDIQRSSALLVGPEVTTTIGNYQHHSQQQPQPTHPHVQQTQPQTTPPTAAAFATQLNHVGSHHHIRQPSLEEEMQIDDADSTSNTADNSRSSKVRRCFGNTMCMPQNLLCFKHSPELGTSPENTFVPNNIHRKRISAAKLLNENTCSYNNSSDEASSIGKSPADITDMDISQATKSDCPCRASNSDSCDEEDSNSLNYDVNSTKPGLFSRVPSQHYKVGKFLIAVHRKITRQDTYFLSYHKTRPSLFGVPLLIPCCESGTNKDLYCAVWVQVNRLLSPLPPAPDQSNHAADCDDSLGYDFPFTLRAVTSDGLTCALCPWTSFCRGCEIPCNDDLLLRGTLIPSSATTSNASTPKLLTKFSSMPNLEPKKSVDISNGELKLDQVNIAIDWDPTALHLRYQSTRERLWTDHESLAICRKERTEPVDLNHCLRAFTSEEKLEQWYHCSHCKGKKPATKKLQIWKLPPILIVHLKRFNCVHGKWVKSQKVVHFPFDDFDPTPYLASVPQETILRHKELLDLKNVALDQYAFADDDVEEEESASSRQGSSESSNDVDHKVDVKKCVQPVDGKNSHRSAPIEYVNDVITEDVVFRNTRSNLDKSIATPTKLANARIERRRRLISSSLTKTPVIDGEFEDFHHHKLNEGVDPFDLKYKLYAVVSHSGMLNGGHYISYASNPNGSWYCYNDSSCREIPKQPNIDPSSAYLLFYERRGLDYEPYLPNIEGKTIPNGNAVEIDDNENDLKKLCTIS